tara:strand:- start:2447 stop:3454 length:1008 start_codon:yes stop_codon:yes gene_type:complete
MSDAQPAADVQENVAAPAEQEETLITALEDIQSDSSEIVSLDSNADSEVEHEEIAAEAEESDESNEEAVEEGGEETGEETDETNEPEMRSFDFGGNKLEFAVDAIPPELATKIDEFSKGVWSSATKSHQETAERAKTLQTQEKTVAKIAELNGEALETYTRGLQERSDLEQLKAVDLNQEWQVNPDRARQISDAIASKEAQFQQTLSLVQQQEEAADAQQKERLATIAAEGVEMLNKRIPNFSTEKAPELLNHVRQQHPNISQRELDAWALNPVITEYAYKAMLYDRQTQATKKRPTKHLAQTKPVKGIKNTGKATLTRKAEKMNMSELSKHLGL